MTDEPLVPLTEAEMNMALAIHKVALERSAIELKVTDMLETGLSVEGAHHKQWALWQIAEILKVSHLLTDIEDKGIAP